MTQLFRAEAIAKRSDRLSGDVAIAVPVPWQAIGYLIFGGLAAALIFLSLASYSRIETVTGVVTPDKGVAAIIPPRGGIITEIPVEEGQRVAAGTVLASIRAEEDQQDGATASALIEEAIALQDASLAAQVDLTGQAAAAQQSQIAAQRAGLEGEIAQLQSQISLQENLVSSAKRDYQRAVEIAERGFISNRDLQAREDNYMSRQQQLLQLQQALGTKRAAIMEAQRNSGQIAAQARSQAALIAANRAQVAQQAASTKGSRAFVMRAPVAGRVTALTAREGQAVAAQSSLMTVVPADAKLRAELSIPSAAIGFVRPGQTVRLAIDAFPYQRFGTVEGKILTVSSSAIGQQNGTGAVVPVYLVTAQLSKTSITGFGKQQPLVSGMTLTARIVTEEQSLLEWLFEPLYAVTKR